MKKFKFTFLFLAFILASVPFHLQIVHAMVEFFSGIQLINYFLLGVFLAFFSVGFFRVFTKGRISDIGAILLAAAIMSYFIFQRKMFLNAPYLSDLFHLAEFFVFGIIINKENNNSKSPIPIIILILTAFCFEMIQYFLPNRILDSKDIWLNSIAGFAGFIVGY